LALGYSGYLTDRADPVVAVHASTRRKKELVSHQQHWQHPRHLHNGQKEEGTHYQPGRAWEKEENRPGE